VRADTEADSRTCVVLKQHLKENPFETSSLWAREHELGDEDKVEEPGLGPRQKGREHQDVETTFERSCEPKNTLQHRPQELKKVHAREVNCIA